MKINDRSRRRRAGFTLIELLVVIAIIAVLVSLTAAAVMKLMIKADETKRRSDISQMQTSLASAKTSFGLDQQFPSLLVLREDGAYNMSNQLEADSANLLMKMFKMTSVSQLANQDWNANGKIDTGVAYTLTGDQCLVFFLGGVIYGSPPGPQGFCTTTAKPAPLGGGGTRGTPAYYFDPKRLKQGSNGFYSYVDPYGTAYAYLSSYKRPNGYNRYGSSDCANLGVAPYWKSVNGTVVTYWNEASFQIISAGPDKTFGQGGALWGVNNPATGNGSDDMSNFAQNLLGAGQ